MKDITKQIEESQDAMRAMLPPTPHRVWEISGVDAHGTERTLRYVQSELSFFEKQDFTTLLGGYLERFSEGEFGISIKELFSEETRAQIKIPTDVDAGQVDEMLDSNIGLIKAIIKVVNQLPDLQIKIMMIALGVPENEQPFVSQVLRGPVWKGGLTDEQGFDVLKTFVSQNAVALRDFFLEKAVDLWEHAQRELFPVVEEDKNGSTPGGKPSSTMPVPSDSTPSLSAAGPPPASS